MFFVAGISSISAAFRSVENRCKSDFGSVLAIFMIFFAVVAANFYLFLTDKEVNLKHRLVLMALAAFTNFCVFYTGRLFVECSDDPDQDHGMKFAHSFAQVVLLLSNVSATNAMFSVNFSGILMLSLTLLHGLLMLATGVHPFHTVHGITGACGISGKECIQKEKDPNVVRNWLKKIFETADSNGVSCERRAKQDAGMALDTALLNDDGTARPYFPASKTIE